jgi:chromosome segregation ATPase
VIERFLRLFPLFKKQEAALDEMAAALAIFAKRLASEEALVESLNRHIEALEGRDRERLSKIEELEAKNRDALDALQEALEATAELRARLDGLRPNRKEDP